MKCPHCGEEASLLTPDYGYGYGAEFRCYNYLCPGGTGDGCRFASSSPEAKQASDESRASSWANAQKLKSGSE